MYSIIANQKGSRSINISDAHLQTLRQYRLLSNLVGSTGIYDESVLDKLKLNVRSLLEGEAGKDKALLDLALDVIYHQNMKALGLENLTKLYKQWEQSAEKPDQSDQSDLSDQSEKSDKSETPDQPTA